MVVHKQHFAGGQSKFFDNSCANPQFLLDPADGALFEQTAGQGPIAKGRSEESLELEEWFFVQDDEIEVLRLDLRLSETEMDGACVERCIILDAAKAFLLGRGDEQAVL